MKTFIHLACLGKVVRDDLFQKVR